MEGTEKTEVLFCPLSWVLTPTCELLVGFTHPGMMQASRDTRLKKGH